MVYVLAKNGKPLMPTENYGYVRILLKDHRAVVVRKNPFTIRLKFNTTTYTQPLICGIDPGRTNIGIAVTTEDGQCVFSANADTHNKEVPERMADRKTHRMASRRGERLRRQRRAKKAGTCFVEQKRVLPGCEKPITCKYIKNTEARFNNRKRQEGWLTPTANHLLLCHLNLLKLVQKMLPVSKVVLELNSFAFMAMDTPKIQRWQYQRGPLHGKGSMEDAVSISQNGKCIFCDHAIEHYHHIVPRSKGGSNTLSNIVGLCKDHHNLVHKDEKWTSELSELKSGMNKKYGALSVLNQIIPSLAAKLAAIPNLEVFVTDGRSTKAFRDAHNVSKDHHLDAYCIACSSLDGNISVVLPKTHYALRHFRRHDRAVVSRQEERKYYLGDKLVAKNRNKRMEQKGDSLKEFRTAHPKDVANLKVVKGTAKYKNLKRTLPGAIFLVDNMELVLQGSTGLHNGKPDYYVFCNVNQKYSPKKCKKISIGGGWQFIPSSTTKLQ